MDKFKGDYIIKKIKKYKTNKIKFNDSSIKDSLSETLFDEKEVKIFNENLIEQKKITIIFTKRKRNTRKNKETIWGAGNKKKAKKEIDYYK